MLISFPCSRRVEGGIKRETTEWVEGGSGEKQPNINLFVKPQNNGQFEVVSVNSFKSVHDNYVTLKNNALQIYSNLLKTQHKKQVNI